MQKDSTQAKISLKVLGGLLFLTHPVYSVIAKLKVKVLKALHDNNYSWI